jgi:hypothetical protein
MLARISAVFETTEREFWLKITEPKSLQFVAAPILSFEPLIAGSLDDDWEVGKNYELKLKFLNFIPLGDHNIKLVAIDHGTNIIKSEESGKLTSVWNHTIRFHPLGPNKLHYTDEIEIKAGWLTPFVWAFAHIFYRHRQRRWKILLKN